MLSAKAPSALPDTSPAGGGGWHPASVSPSSSACGGSGPRMRVEGGSSRQGLKLNGSLPARPPNSHRPRHCSPERPSSPRLPKVLSACGHVPVRLPSHASRHQSRQSLCAQRRQNPRHRVLLPPLAGEVARECGSKGALLNRPAPIHTPRSPPRADSEPRPRRLRFERQGHPRRAPLP